MRTTPAALAYTQGCEVVAAAIRARIGGELVTIRPVEGATFLPAIANGSEFGLGMGWWTHTVVLRAGMVFDEITGPRGMTVDAYRALWHDSEYIRFGF